MKKNFWKFLALAIAALMMMSTVAFAEEVATPAIDGDPVVAEEVVTVTLSGMTNGDEATILVVNDGVELGSVTNDDIVYIDQLTVSGTTVTFTFDASNAVAVTEETATEDKIVGSKYVDVYCGYTSMADSPVLNADDVLVLQGEVVEATVVSISLDKDTYEKFPTWTDTAKYEPEAVVAGLAVVTANMSDGTTQPIDATECTFTTEYVKSDNGTTDVLTDDYYDTVVTATYGSLTDTATFVYYGDANYDGRVNARDKQSLAQYVAKWDDVSFNKANGNVRTDTGINARDKQNLARYVAKWDGYETLPLS